MTRKIKLHLVGQDPADIFNDLDKLKADSAASPPQPEPTRKGWRRICTVLPREWELRLQGVKRISTYRLAIELLYLHWYGKGKPVTVSSKVAKAAKLSDRSKWNALAELKLLGLIEVNRKPRRSPRVALLHTQTPQT
jgi:hypothetical protein